MKRKIDPINDLAIMELDFEDIKSIVVFIESMKNKGITFKSLTNEENKFDIDVVKDLFKNFKILNKQIQQIEIDAYT